MTTSPEISEHPSETPTLLGLSDDDRARLGEALQELMAHGSIIGLESGKSALYHSILVPHFTKTPLIMLG